MLQRRLTFCERRPGEEMEEWGKRKKEEHKHIKYESDTVKKLKKRFKCLNKKIYQISEE